jgi:hypothetical protein
MSKQYADMCLTWGLSGACAGGALGSGSLLHSPSALVDAACDAVAAAEAQLSQAWLHLPLGESPCNHTAAPTS